MFTVGRGEIWGRGVFRCSRFIVDNRSHSNQNAEERTKEKKRWYRKQIEFWKWPIFVICQLYHEFRKNLIFRKLYVICSDIHFLLCLIINLSILGGEFIASMSHSNGKWSGIIHKGFEQPRKIKNKKSVNTVLKKFCRSILPLENNSM